jgi:tRNA(fMet)-specific endonuclease VapC
MILLDTDHTTFLKYPDSERGRRMIDRLNSVSASDVIGVAIVTVEERLRGWLAVIAKEKTGCGKSSVIASWPCCSSSTKSSKSCRSMRQRPDDLMISAGRSIGTRDLKIAATALVNHALLLSANRADFERVPGLRVENWLD